MRLPQAHDTVRQGLVTPLIEVARAKGVSAYVGEGLSRWPAAHVLDVARLYRLVIEKCEPGARYHAVAEEDIRARDMAQAIVAGLGVPVKSISLSEAGDHIGWLGGFVGLDLLASSAWTRKVLGWEPNGPGLLTGVAFDPLPVCSTADDRAKLSTAAAGAALRGGVDEKLDAAPSLARKLQLFIILCFGLWQSLCV
jgi:hypothetical protein